MNLSEKFQLYGLMLFSVISSFVFVFYTVNVYFSDSATTWLRGFAYVTGGYGLFNIYVLSWAWNSRSDWSIKADMLLAGCFLGVFIMNALRHNFYGGLNGVAAVIVLAVVLYINVQAVKKVCARPGA